MKRVVTVIVAAMLACSMLSADAQKDDLPVRIAPDNPWLYVNHMGQKVKVAHIQDRTNRLTDDYTETSRACPPFCIHPKALSAIIQGNHVLLKEMNKAVYISEVVSDY